MLKSLLLAPPLALRCQGSTATGAGAVPPVTPPLSALCPHGLAQGRHRGGNQNISVYSWSGSQLPWKQGSVATSLTLEVGVTEGSSVLALQDQPRTTILRFLRMQSHLRQVLLHPRTSVYPSVAREHAGLLRCLRPFLTSSLSVPPPPPTPILLYNYRQAVCSLWASVSPFCSSLFLSLL